MYNINEKSNLLESAIYPQKCYCIYDNTKFNLNKSQIIIDKKV